MRGNLPEDPQWAALRSVVPPMWKPNDRYGSSHKCTPHRERRGREIARDELAREPDDTIARALACDRESRFAIPEGVDRREHAGPCCAVQRRGIKSWE